MAKKSVVIFVFSLALTTSFAFADIQVVDYSTKYEKSKHDAVIVPAISTSGLSFEQRINKLEKQINNVNEQNFTSKIDELQQRVQKQDDQIEEQDHKIEQLNSQLRQSLEKPKTNEIIKEKPIETAIEPVVANKKIDNYKNETTKDIDKISSKDKKSIDEQEMYKTAIDLLKDRRYEKSYIKLQEYLKAYPKGAYVSNAHYWLGEINLKQKDYKVAEKEFKIVINEHSKSKNVSDAKFGLALVHQHNGEIAKTEYLSKKLINQSKEELKEVIKLYPESQASRFAKEQLKGND